MKLETRIDGETVNIEIVRDGAQVKAKVGDREYGLEITEPEPNVFALRNGAALTEVFVSPIEPGQPVKAVAKGREFEFELIDPKRLRGSGADAADAGGAADIKTAMPGKVVRLLVELGAEVKKGDGIIVVEAMKMQNEIKSPKDGVVKEIKAAEGQTVNAGEVLAIVE